MGQKEKKADFPPSDWPKDGPIDLNIHDLPHNSSTTEWWYMNAHFTSKNNHKISLFASFFRVITGYEEKSKKPIYGHSVIWAVSDHRQKKYHTVSLVDKTTPHIGLQRIKRGEMVKDPFIRKAAIEMLAKGVVPYPDELLKQDVIVSRDKLFLNFDNNTFKKQKDGTYLLNLIHEELGINAELKFTPQKPPVRHGNNGLVEGVKGEDMFYYFIPRCDLKGHVTIKKEKMEVINGSGWYDHEFGCAKQNEQKTAEKDVSWNWVSAQLDNGCEFSAYDLVDLKTKKSCGSYAILIDKNGKRFQSNNFRLVAVGSRWTSTRTFAVYPVEWQVDVPDFDLSLKVSASFPNQEFGTVISRPAFWEGCLEVSGTIKGKKINGQGYFERHGYMAAVSMREFLKAVSAQTLKSVKKIIPVVFDQEKLEELVSKKGNKHFTAGLDKKTYIDAYIKPMREIMDRGGKSWRSYATIACCDVVGGESHKAIDWLALPELMHVGSLIVDDVEDRSDIRRGGPAAHKIYGEAKAINSGTACYFLGQFCIYQSDHSAEKKIQIYDWYFETMRACHSGQAMDIHGLDYMMKGALNDDKIAKMLYKRVLATHRLKSAAPASYLARIGALLGNGTPEQIEGLGNYFEAIGIAFQMIDDTLNIKGFRDNLKIKGEDISAGKITYPVARGMSLLSKKERKRLWEIVSAKTTDTRLLSEALGLLDKYRVIEQCEKEAKNILENAWKKLDPLLRDSMVKLNLRAFSWFVLERTY